MLPRTIWLLAGVLVSTTGAYPFQEKGEPPIVLSVCEALADAAKYNGKLVTITGAAAGTDEGSWVKGIGCPTVSLGGRDWQPLIWITGPGATGNKVNFGLDIESLNRSIEAYRRLARQVPERCIALTYTGRFETRTRWEDFIINFPDGRIRHVGYGHLGEAPAQVIMRSYDSVSRIAGCR